MLSTLKKAISREVPQPGFYQPKERRGHCTVFVNNDLYVWGGDQDGLPEVHNSDLKLRMTSIVEVFRCKVGRWHLEKTTGQPPLGVRGGAICAIGNKIYHFGGWCNHDHCLHNTLHELDIDHFKWSLCLADGPTKKSVCGMVAFDQTLLVVGGIVTPPKNPQPLAQYDGERLPQQFARSNEHHLHDLGTDHWRSPSVTGDKPPPINGFTLSKIANEKALLYGGDTAQGPSSELRVAKVLGDSVHWEKLVPHGPEKPRGRFWHSVCVIHSPSNGDQQTLLLLTGGLAGFDQLLSDAWFLCIGDDASWREIKNMPPSVTVRYRNSMNIIAASHSSVWLMAVGGLASVFSNEFASSCLLLELNLSPSGVLEVGAVLEGDEIYQGYSARFLQKFLDHCETDTVTELAASTAVGRTRRGNDFEKQLEPAQAKLQDKDQQIREKDQRLKLYQQQLLEKDKSLQCAHQQVQELRSNLSRLSTEPWVISREELTFTEELLGSGAYGEVRIALFRGLKVAAKCLHNIIISDYNLRIFSREMTIASRLRHPNLLLFIGATTQGCPPIILTELMATSLRAELAQHPLSNRQIKSIAMDVAYALNYLHQWKPDPIIHRDVSSPNVLLKPSGANSWEAKVSDYGSANFIQQITKYSVAPGNPAYAAPEARFPDDHSPKMDVYSFGVLLFEMCLQEQPEMSVAGRAEQAKMVLWGSLAQIIKECIAHLPKDRPTIARVMEELKPILV